MKKLMVAAAVAFAAIASQAAYVNWALSNVKDAEGNALTKGIVYMFASTETISTDPVTALTGKGALAVQTFMADANYSYKYSDLTSTSAGNFTMSATTMGSKENTPTNGDMGMAGSTPYNMYAVIFDTDTITDASKFYVTDIKKNSTYGDSTESARSWAFGVQNTSGKWNAVAVPEPTSGILLLLGVAGMALRRRRA